MKSVNLDGRMAALSGVSLSDLPVQNGEEPGEFAAPVKVVGQGGTDAQVADLRSSQQNSGLSEKEQIHQLLKNEALNLDFSGQSREQNHQLMSSSAIPLISGRKSERQSEEKHYSGQK